MKNKNRPYLAIVVMLVIIAVAVAGFMQIASHQNPKSNDRDLSGSVIGNNPDNIPKQDLPICNFDGSKFLKEPCYSPPGAMYE